jgi:D-inositol-3-phosphate glycosyltransferase
VSDVISRFPRRAPLRRVAMLSLHTSPLEQPGIGDAGGMNVYVVELARRLGAMGVEVEVFTRAVSGDLPPVVEFAPGCVVRHVAAGPLEPLAKERWGVPLVHTMHTMARVKNAALADGDAPEPSARAIGEAQVVDAADRLIANTDAEARQLIQLYDADPARVAVVAPGVDLLRYRPGDRDKARAATGLPMDRQVLLFVGRIQPLKAPDLLVRALAVMVDRQPELRDRLLVVIVGGPSGSGTAEPKQVQQLATALGVDDLVRFEPPACGDDLADFYRAADLVVVPSYSESFGLVALEAQACGVPVVAARVGGLETAVLDGVSGALVDGHDPRVYADVLRSLLDDPVGRRRMSAAAVRHASGFGWDRTVDGVLDVYVDALGEEARRATTARSAGVSVAGRR